MKNLQIKKIETIFKKCFKFDSFKNSANKHVNFHCPLIKACKVNVKADPIYTGIPTTNETDIMVIAEAPSAVGGVGAKISSFIEHIEVSKKSELYELIEFIKDTNNGKYPYFTDIIKCGFKNQKAKDIKLRKSNCVDLLLLKEIEAVNPQKIYCVGKSSYNMLCELKKNGRINKKIDLISLLHYSRNGNLIFSIKDKKLIWLRQSNKINKEEFIQLIPKMDAFKNLLS